MPPINNPMNYDNAPYMYGGNNSDDNTDYSDYSDYDDYDEEDVFYEEGELSNTKYNIVLCEIFNSLIHGKSNSQVNSHYLNICTFKQLNMSAVEDMCNLYNEGYLERINQLTRHKFIRNYHNIITNPNYIKPEIGEKIYLPSGHIVCVIKTIWLKLIQRAWKKTYKNKLDVIQKRYSIHAIRTREITGKWPENCRYLPNIRGMLSGLSR
jgi:hypothetical protein